ncbi:aldose 1-epimerase [Raphidocelis subcapitata]|uniref:Aldose 1-epimerase n=1 Tax=Raphidocelis subcapitata TaxID=307507 RepID=A0A2V0PLF2_9CHLO|nr:aldose 1-epimerase [Raphidocelis subcapitata]|eukprot:GBF97855.1 aldose 1-epimerase [Raphidocelis subcapitata]
MLPQLLGAAGLAALSAAALLVARRLRLRRYYDQLPRLRLGPNKLGVSAVISPVGASILELTVPDAQGKPVDVVLGFERASAYALTEGTPYFGAVVGRCANRIAKGRFSLGGKDYQLAVNNGPNALHGGPDGFHRRVFQAERRATGDGGEAVVCTYTSKDGEEGYPGTLTVTVTYELPAELPELRTTITATTDQATPVNIAQHTYFNLAGHDSGTVLDHSVMVNASSYTLVDPDLIPTGEVAPVEGTPFDFRQPHSIGERIGELENGYDHNFALFGLDRNARHVVRCGRATDTPRLAAEVTEPTRGIRLRVLTTAPGMQFYTGGFLSSELPGGKGGARYGRFGGFAMETQAFPDSINQPNFPSVVLQPGEEYNHELIYHFGLASDEPAAAGPV